MGSVTKATCTVLLVSLNYTQFYRKKSKILKNFIPNMIYPLFELLIRQCILCAIAMSSVPVQN